MKGLVRLLAAAGVALGALVFTTTAMASYTTPRLEIRNPSEKLGGGGPLTIRVTQHKDDDATFRLLIYVPQGYVSSLVPRDGMPQIGTVEATIQANAISQDAIVPVTGRILGDNTYTAEEYPNAPACLSGLTIGRIDAVYLLEMTASGQTLRVPMYVTTVLQEPEALYASGRMVACLPSPYVPPAQGGATLGAKLVTANLTFNGMFTNPTTRGDYRWRAFWTPWNQSPATPNALGTVETQAVDRIPVQLGIRAAMISNGRLTVTGSLLENRVGKARAAVRIYVGRTARGVKLRRVVRTNARGVYTARLRYRAPGPVFVRARVVVPARTANGCESRTNPAITCLRTAFSSYALFNNRRVRVR